jgi:hypothetical protein
MQKMVYLLVSKHVSGIVMPIIRRMHLVGYLFTFMIQDARSHEINYYMYFILFKVTLFIFSYSWIGPRLALIIFRWVTPLVFNIGVVQLRNTCRFEWVKNTTSITDILFYLKCRRVSALILGHLQVTRNESGETVQCRS